MKEKRAGSVEGEVKRKREKSGAGFRLFLRKIPSAEEMQKSLPVTVYEDFLEVLNKEGNLTWKPRMPLPMP